MKNLSLPIQVIHYTKNYSRKKFLNRMFVKENIFNVTWVEEYDKENVTYEDFRENFEITETQYNNRQPSQFPWMLHRLKPEEVSVAIKHKTALQNLVKSKNDYVLILEDDIILENNFLEKLNFYIDKLPDNWEVAFIGQAVDKRISKTEIIDGKYWYKKDYPADRCADSYLIKRSTAQKILSQMNYHKMCFPYDHELSHWFRILNTNVYWLEPPITAQGSQCGIFETFQEPHSRFHNENFKNIRNDLEELLDGI